VGGGGGAPPPPTVYTLPIFLEPKQKYFVKIEKTQENAFLKHFVAFLKILNQRSLNSFTSNLFIY
jgi:hypothetical protein